jgi:hypothetical protein
LLDWLAITVGQWQMNVVFPHTARVAGFLNLIVRSVTRDFQVQVAYHLEVLFVFREQR